LLPGEPVRLVIRLHNTSNEAVLLEAALWRLSLKLV
jgi:hypothetical protein